MYVIGLRVGWGVLVLLCLVCLPLVNAAPKTAHIYGFAGLPSTESLLKYFSETNCEAVFHDLNNTTSSERFLKIAETLRASGIHVTPPSLCIPCERLHQTWNETLMGYASPLVGFFWNGRLTSITIGIAKSEVLDKALSAKRDSDVKVFAFDSEHSLSDEDAKALGDLFLGEFVIDPLNLVSSVTLLALADCVNPCTFAIFTAVLFVALHSFGKAKAGLRGLSFITAVFACHSLLGLGVIRILVAIPCIDKVVALVGLAIGAFNITRGLKPQFRSPIPESLRISIESLFSKPYVGPIASFLLGAVASFTLLLCGGGPYIVGLGLLSGLKDPVLAYLLLILYNALFVTPLVAILLIALASRIHARKVKSLGGTKLGVMESISGSILAAVCAYLLLS